MPKILNILIVENEQQDIQAYLDTINTINKENEGIVILKPSVRVTKDEGLNALKEDIWSAAFIDMKLSTGNILKAQEGNDIVKEIYQKKRFPVFVLTNTPEDVSPEFKRSFFLRVNSKDGIDYHQVLSEVIKIDKTGIFNILGKKGIIEKYLDEIFWNNISSSLEDWYNINESERPLLRYTLSHFLEYLEISDEGNFDTFYPIETYISPSIKKHPFTGDIIKIKNDDGNFYVVLTPACDLAPHGKEQKPKTDRVLVAEVEGYDQNIISSFVKKLKKANDETSRNIEEGKILKLITNNFAQQYFYLPQTSIFPGGVINFRKLTTLKLSDLTEKYSRIGNLSNQFVKDLVARFSFYYSRQGAPDFDFNSLLKIHSA